MRSGTSASRRSSSDCVFRAPGAGTQQGVSRATRQIGLDEAAPEAESPEGRSGEQEVAAGRTASTPVAVLGGVVGVVALAVVVVLVLVVVAYALA